MSLGDSSLNVEGASGIGDTVIMKLVESAPPAPSLTTMVTTSTPHQLGSVNSRIPLVAVAAKWMFGLLIRRNVISLFSLSSSLTKPSRMVRPNSRLSSSLNRWDGIEVRTGAELIFRTLNLISVVSLKAVGSVTMNRRVSSPCHLPCGMRILAIRSFEIITTS